MQEAFRRAALQNPDIPISQDINRSISEGAKRRELEYLNREFGIIGKEWFLVKASPLRASRQRITESSVRQKWGGMVPRLQRYNSEDQIILLNQFCQGMGLSEENHHPGYYSVIEELSTIWGEIELLQKVRGKKSLNLSHISRMFLDVFKDISAYSDETKASLDDFINTKANLPSGRIFLPETLSAVTLWLKRPQPSSRSTNSGQPRIN